MIISLGIMITSSQLGCTVFWRSLQSGKQCQMSCTAKLLTQPWALGQQLLQESLSAALAVRQPGGAEPAHLSWGHLPAWQLGAAGLMFSGVGLARHRGQQEQAPARQCLRCYSCSGACNNSSSTYSKKRGCGTIKHASQPVPATSSTATRQQACSHKPLDAAPGATC